jgi:hypothetical protein
MMMVGIIGVKAIIKYFIALNGYLFSTGINSKGILDRLHILWVTLPFQKASIPVLPWVARTMRSV